MGVAPMTDWRGFRTPSTRPSRGNWACEPTPSSGRGRSDGEDPLRSGPSGGAGLHLVSACLVLAVAAAGCLASEPGPGAPPEADAAASVHPVWVHRPGGEPVDAGLYPGDLPVMVQRDVDRGSGYEPTVAIDGNGTAFYAVYSPVLDGTVPTSLSQMRLMRSRDDGTSWQEVTPQIAGRDAVPMAWDTYLYHDPRSDRIWMSYTYVGCMEVLWTDDQGATWDRYPVACAAPLNDHESLFSGPPTERSTQGYPSVMYLCSNPSVTPTAHCATSVDGGGSWIPAAPITAPSMGPAERASCTVAEPFTRVIHGHAQASYVDGGAYVPYNYCDGSYVAVSRDNGLSWSNVLVDDTAGSHNHEAHIAVDEAGNLYHVWVGEGYHPHLAISRDAGETWSDPIDVAARTADLTVPRYISVTSGAPGRVAVHYIATDDDAGPDGSEAGLRDAAWHSYVSFLPDALADDPVIATTTSNPPDDPIHRGACSIYGGPNDHTCPRMSHYIDLESDPATGRVWASFADVCRRECPDGDASSPTTNQAAVGVQVGGTFLGGREIPDEPTAANLELPRVDTHR